MAKTEILPNGNIRIRVDYLFSYQGGRKKILDKGSTDNLDMSVLNSIALAYRWQSEIDNGEYKNIQALADSLKIDQSYVARTIRLAYLSPKIVRLFLQGKAPSGLSLSRLRQAFPDDWKEQEDFFGIQSA